MVRAFALAPQQSWEANEPCRSSSRVLDALKRRCRAEFNGRQTSTESAISLADLIVLGGCRGRGGSRSTSWRASTYRGARSRRVAGDATDAQTNDADILRCPGARRQTDFRNYLHGRLHGARPSSSCWWTEPSILTLTAPEMTVLVGGLPCPGSEHTERLGGTVSSPIAPVHADQRLLRESVGHGHSSGGRTSDKEVICSTVGTVDVSDDLAVDRNTPWTWSSGPTPSSGPWLRSTRCDDAKAELRPRTSSRRGRRSCASTASTSKSAEARPPWTTVQARKRPRRDGRRGRFRARRSRTPATRSLRA